MSVVPSIQSGHGYGDEGRWIMRAEEDYRTWQHGGSTWHQANQNQEKIRAQIRRGGAILVAENGSSDKLSIFERRPNEHLHCSTGTGMIMHVMRNMYWQVHPFSFAAQCQSPRRQPKAVRVRQHYRYCQLGEKGKTRFGMVSPQKLYHLQRNFVFWIRK